MQPSADLALAIPGFSEEVLSAADGVPLRIHYRVRGGRPMVVFVNAIGIPASILAAPLTRLAREDVDLVTWEIRGCRQTGSPDSMSCGMDDHLRDLDCVLSRFGAKEAHLVGWSTGAAIALKAAAHTNAVQSLTLLAGTFASREREGTPFFNNMKAVAEYWERGKDYLAKLYRTGVPAAGAPKEESKTVEIVGQKVSADVAALARYPFRDIDHFYAYCRRLMHWEREKCESVAPHVRQHCLFLCGSNDTLSNNEISKDLHGRLEASSYFEFDRGTHYFFVDSTATTVEMILSHVFRGRTDTPRERSARRGELA